MTEYLLSSLELLESKYPDCGLIIAEDFNKLPIHRLTRQFQFNSGLQLSNSGLQQVGLNLNQRSRVLRKPNSYSTIGSFRPCSVLAPPKIRVKEEQSTQVKYLRDKRPSSIGRLGGFFGEIP